MKSCTCNPEWLGFVKATNGVANDEDLMPEHFRLTTAWSTSAVFLLTQIGRTTEALRLVSLASALHLCPVHNSGTNTAFGRRLLERLSPDTVVSAYMFAVHAEPVAVG